MKIPFIWLLTLPLYCFANIIEVGKGREYEMIGDALQIAVAYDTLVIYEGHYREHSLVVNKPLTILAHGDVIIDAQGAPADIWLVRSDFVTISGLTLRNVGPSFLKEIAAVKTQQVSGVTISDNDIDSCFFGVYLEYTSDSKVIDNRISGSVEEEASAGNAIHVWKGKNLEIMQNVTTGHRDGIYFEFVDSSEIVGNHNHGNLRYGLHFMFSNDDRYSDNIFTNNGAGVAVMFSKRIRMIENLFRDNWGSASYGLLLKEISHGEIGRNRFVNNTTAILAEGASGITMSSNVFLSNGTAVDIKGNCIDNSITTNNFISNTFDVVTNSKYNSNDFVENYWSNYSGYDLDRDGFGDVPYRPVDLFSRIIHEIPSAMILVHSLVVNLFNSVEKVFPSLIPTGLTDDRPRLIPYRYD